jgi:hypothetical protein
LWVFDCGVGFCLARPCVCSLRPCPAFSALRVEFEDPGVCRRLPSRPQNLPHSEPCGAGRWWFWVDGESDVSPVITESRRMAWGCVGRARDGRASKQKRIALISIVLGHILAIDWTRARDGGRIGSEDILRRGLHVRIVRCKANWYALHSLSRDGSLLVCQLCTSSVRP